MFTTSSALAATSGLVGVVLVTGALGVVTLERKAAQDETRSRSFELSTALETVDSTMIVDGEEMEGRGMGGGATTRTSTLLVTDVFEAADGTRPTTIRRTYEAMTRDTERGGGAGGDRGGFEMPQFESELAGEDVLFVWDAEAGAYTAKLPEDSTLDEEILEGLVADLDLALLLPSGPVEIDDSWQVPFELLSHVQRPGGNLHLALPEREGSEGRRGRIGRGFSRPDPAELGVEPEYDGSIRATLKEIRGEGDARVARIALLFDVTSTLDLSDAIEDVTRATPRGDMTVVTLEATTTDVIDGTGEVLWNIAGGHLVSLTIDTELEREQIQATETSFDGEARTFERHTIETGSLDFSYSVE